MVGDLSIAPYLQQWNEMGAEQIPELEALVQAHPWSSAYRTLLAKAYTNAALPHAESKLQLASLYTGDREILYTWMQGNTPQLVKSDAVAQEGIDKEEVSSAPEHQSSVDFDELVTYDPLAELVPEDRAHMETHDEIFEQVTYNPEVELTKLAEEDRDHDFYYWLDHVEDEEKPEKSQEESSSVDQVTDLLARFLENKKNKPREKRAFYNPEEKAKQSEINDSEVVSETLAQIYQRQELYSSAIETYRKLSLQNPDKSAYFAARIAEIERIIHTKEE